MGYAKASELLFFNSKITAGQAKDWGLVSEVIPSGRFEEEAWNKVKKIAELPIRVSANVMLIPYALVEMALRFLVPSIQQGVSSR